MPPARAKTEAIDSPPRRGSGRPISLPTVPLPGKITKRIPGAIVPWPASRAARRTKAAPSRSSYEPFVHDPMSALEKVIRSRATSSAGKALPGLNGLAIIGTTAVRSSLSSIAKRAAGPETSRGFDGAMPRSRYHASVISSCAKRPFWASASAIMLAIVLR